MAVVIDLTDRTAAQLEAALYAAHQQARVAGSTGSPEQSAQALREAGRIADELDQRGL